MQGRPAPDGICVGCGATMPAVDDLCVLSARCSYCGREGLLANQAARHAAISARDARLYAARFQEDARRAQAEEAVIRARRETTRNVGSLVGTLARVAFPLLIFGFVITIVFVTNPLLRGQVASLFSSATAAPPVPAPTPPPGAFAPVGTPSTVGTATADGAAAAARLAALLEPRTRAGCDRVLMAPQVLTGAQSFTADLARNGRCVELTAVTTAPSMVALTMTTPIGAAADTPAPAAEVTFRYCARLAGSYSVHATPTTAAPYAFAALDCRPTHGGGTHKPQSR